MRAVVICLLVPHLVVANDPAGSWLTYAVWKDPAGGKITALNTTWTVPGEPAVKFGSNAPGWWFGVQTAKGDGALVQPILAYGYQGNFYSIFNGVFDWTDGSWHTSDETLTVQPGDKIVSSVTTSDSGVSYDMRIASAQTGKSVSTNYKILPKQTETESVAYFVLEHQPTTCKAYPSNGECVFENIYLEVEGKEVGSPVWEAKDEKPACSSKTSIVDPKTIKITWDATAPTDSIVLETGASAPLKWADATKTPHYEKPPCQAGETEAQVSGAKGYTCAPACPKGTCATDVPAGVTAKPECALADPLGNKYCILECSSDDECDTSGGAKCALVQPPKGVCLYLKPSTTDLTLLTFDTSSLVV